MKEGSPIKGNKLKGEKTKGNTNVNVDMENSTDDELKCTPKKIIVDEYKREELDDNDIFQRSIKKIEYSTNKLDEIEKKLDDQIEECNRFISIYDKSKSLLDSKDFSSSVGREEEISEIRNIFQRCSMNNKTEGIFLTGPSGQGKTYSIFNIIYEIEKEKDKEKLLKKTKKKQKEKEETQKEFYKNIDASYYYVSCSNCDKPYDIFVDIIQQIMNKDKRTILNTIKQKYNVNGLDEVKKIFINYTSKLNNLRIVIVDEMDFIAVKNARVELRTKTQNKTNSDDVIKCLFECVQHDKCKIILVGIANSFDLLKDYTHLKINQITYKPYTEKQFMSIIKNKLNSLEEELVQKLFKGVSLNIHVRQIANRNGDIRACFDAILRVLSEKTTDLLDRKKSLCKLKEEIVVNKIFNEHEKRNLAILCYTPKKETNLMKRKRNKTDTEEISPDNKRNGKRTKMKNTDNEMDDIINKSYTTETNASSCSENFHMGDNESTVTPQSFLPNTQEQKFSKNVQGLTFTNLKYRDAFDYERLKKESMKLKNDEETMGGNVLIKKDFENSEEKDSEYSFYSNDNDANDIVANYQSPFKVLYQNSENQQNENNEKQKGKEKGKRKELYDVGKEEKQFSLGDMDLKKLHVSLDEIVDNQLKSLESKYNDLVNGTNNNNAVLISDFKKITDKMPLEEHKDILLKIKSLPLIQKIYLYASCNVVKAEHDYEEEGEEEEQEEQGKDVPNIEITYADIQKSFRVLCSQLSECAQIKDILEGGTIDQAIEHFEELGILTNTKKGKEKNIKMSKSLTPRFATKRNTINFTNQNKINTVYNFNLPIKVVRHTLKEISSILAAFEGSSIM